MATKAESFPRLFDAVKAKFPSSLGPDRWHLVAASALITYLRPLKSGYLWNYLTSQPDCQTLEQRRALNKRLREFFVKQWVTIGVPKAAVALFSLIKKGSLGTLIWAYETYQFNSDALGLGQLSNTSLCRSPLSQSVCIHRNLILTRTNTDHKQPSLPPNARATPNFSATSTPRSKRPLCRAAVVQTLNG
ncbi:hypothetical protein HO173_008294 [Letharia columbiana]|uniref:Uncharacterized protein n=1 Tax=Letharia columbiana TaxID=112416 RepID=A0A8H6FRH7_9LECA|nr:uncharacterized protein HO173_008294 [Letharia columbiana]KAF6233362.1 hypothetical protein HO173_008294 [Letharia columbiana]